MATRQKKPNKGREVYIVDGGRSPFLKAHPKPGPFTAADLAVNTCKSLLQRQPFAPTEIQEVITGCMIPSTREANISRIIAVRLGCGVSVPAWTVQRNCASGMQALDSAAFSIASGRSDLVLAGGVESMSHAPLLLSEKFTTWLGAWNQAKHIKDRALLLTQLRPVYFKPIIALLQGLTDPLCGLSMGQTAEILAYKFKISRKESDEFALRSNQLVAKAQDDKALSEIITIYDKRGNFYSADDGVHRDSSLEALAKLKPIFDRKYGQVTAGNSSQVTDGAAFLLLASEDAVKKYGLPVMARIVDTHWAGLEPSEMGLGPAYAIPPLLARNSLEANDIDYWEINEAFAAQVLACLKVLQDKDYCQKYLGLKDAFGKIDESRLNIHGGAIAMGHPVGASGARLVLQLINILKSKNAKRGVASLCIGGGQGGAMLIETTDSAEGSE